MKILILYIFISIITLLSYSQDLPFYKNYIFDQTLLNPALGAKYDFMTLKLTGSNQWTSLPNNPIMQTLSFNLKYKNKMGFNLAILNEKYGIITNAGFKLSYFYYIKLNTKGDLLSFGISGSLMQFKMDYTQLYYQDLDPVIPNETVSDGYPNAGFGMFYQKQNLSLGFSAGNLFPYKPSFFNETLEPNKARVYFLYADYNFTNEIKTFSVVPSIMIMLDENMQRQINLNAKIMYRSFFWAGISYRDALSGDDYAMHNILAMLGFQFFKRLNIGYGYDFGVLSTSLFGSTHNFYIGYNFIKKDKDIPMFM
jgi:type IX secretion system PorP/SprF family membrane protein